MKLNLHTPLAKTGYGVVGFNILKSLLDLSVDVSLHLIGQGGHINNEEEKKLFENIMQKSHLFDPYAPTLKIWHQFALSERIGHGLYAAMPIFELNRFNEKEKSHLQCPHRLYVNSKWAKTVILEEIPSISEKSICVIPLGVDTSIFYPSTQPKEKDSPYVFLNIGKLEVRKGHDILTTLFSQAFTSSDNVELWMCNHNPFFTQEENEQWNKYFHHHSLGDKIKIIPPLNTNVDIANLIRRVDCGIFPSRAEGWNLEILEMMACGKSIITTNYSGHTEFCNQKNSYLVKIDELEDAYDGKWFNGQGQWAKLGQSQQDEIINFMQYCYKNRPVNQEGVKTAKEFSWNNAAQKIIDDAKQHYWPF